MRERVMVIDGAMGTTVQQYKFSEEDFRGAWPALGWPSRQPLGAAAAAAGPLG